MKMNEVIAVTGVTMFVLATPAFSQSSTVAGFDGGSDDGFTGNAFFEAADGNPGGHAHHAAPVFFNELRTGAPAEPANAAFLGDYTQFAEVTLSVDVKTESLTDFIGNQIARPIGIKLWNRDIQGPDSDAGVYVDLGILGVNFTPEWTTLSVTFDPTSTELPPGWIGFGDVNKFFEPQLPDGVTFADILANVTQFDVTGAVPGFFFTDAFFDVRVDNITVALPEENECPWDLDGDGNVFATDLLLLLMDFGSCEDSPADFDGDGCVTVTDLLTLLANFGPCDAVECDSPADCDDGDPCTVDLCIQGACYNVPIGGPNCGGSAN